MKNQLKKQFGLSKGSLLLLITTIMSASLFLKQAAHASSVNAQPEQPIAEVKVQPRYPVQAAYEGVQGFVELQFNVERDGSTSNIKVINAQPKRVFEEEAIRALSQWKYSPAGRAEANKDIVVKLEFSLGS